MVRGSPAAAGRGLWLGRKVPDRGIVEGKEGVRAGSRADKNVFPLFEREAQAAGSNLEAFALALAKWRGRKFLKKTPEWQQVSRLGEPLINAFGSDVSRWLVPALFSCVAVIVVRQYI